MEKDKNNNPINNEPNKTKQYKVVSKKKKRKIGKIIKRIFLTILLLTLIGAGVGFALIYGIAKEAKLESDELVIEYQNSVVLDIDGNVIANLSGDENREIVTISEMSKYLPKAFVAIEDERFYEHDGVDIKRTAAATGKYILSKIGIGSASYGGSTITQQLVKNLTQEKDRNWERKVKEMARAYYIEQDLSKDQVLELYLNLIFLGGNTYGVEVASNYYFSKSASELTLAESAFLAGINNSPNAYDAFSTEEDDIKKVKNRTKTVLDKMIELKDITGITEEEYNNAVAEVEQGIKFQKGVIAENVYSYHTDALITYLVEDIAEQKGLSKPLATSYLYGGGLVIHSTQVANVQNTIEEEVKNSKYVLASKANPGTNAEGAVVVIDHTNGHVVGCAGGLGEKNSSRGLNRATQSVRQTGSAFKPLAVVGPALQERIITASSIYDDAFTVFPGNYKPKNYNGFKGRITVRQAVETSQNIPFVKIMEQLGVEKSKEYLVNMGISSLTDRDCGLSMAIGGLDKGVSPLEMAAAYATIANNGEYIEPIFYTKVEDSQGNIVLQSTQERHKVFDKDVNYVLQNILQEPVRGGAGTARYCAIGNVDTAAKTGTTNDDYDRWLCGFTTYYTAAAWYGYDVNEEVNYRGTNPAGLLWSGVMKKIHQNVQAKYFTRPSGIISATICKESGLCATETCTEVVTDIFVTGSIPAVCEGHVVEEVPPEEVTPEDLGVNITEEPITKPEENKTPTTNTTPTVDKTPKPTNPSQSPNAQQPNNGEKNENASDKTTNAEPPKKENDNAGANSDKKEDIENPKDENASTSTSTKPQPESPKEEVKPTPTEPDNSKTEGKQEADSTENKKNNQ